MLYFIKLHELKFYVVAHTYIYRSHPLPPLPAAFGTPQNPPPCRFRAWHGFPATPGRACRVGRPDPGWGFVRTTPGPNPPGRFGCAMRGCVLSPFTRGGQVRKWTQSPSETCQNGTFILKGSPSNTPKKEVTYSEGGGPPKSVGRNTDKREQETAN